MRPRMLSDFTPRLYQEKIFSKTTTQNCLVVLPTGLGKTALSIMLCAHRLTLYPDSKVVLLAPTKPLIEQHRSSFAQHLDIDESKLVIFSGEVAPKKREELWKSGRIFFSTPQGFENDLLSRRISLEQVSLLVFDEAHHATGDYAYVTIAKQYQRQGCHARVLGLTASPGSELEKIQEVCTNLSIENIEARTEEDPDVKPYVQKKEVSLLKVTLPETFLSAKKELDTCFKNKLSEIKSLGIVKRTDITSKRDLLSLQSELVKRMTSGERDFEVLKSVSLASECFKVHHGIELLETQGAKPAYEYISRLFREAPSSKTKALKNLVQDTQFKAAFIKIENLVENNITHPKFGKLRSVVEDRLAENPLGKFIVFTQYRDTAATICKQLATDKILPQLFIGQGSKRTKGLTQKQQKAVLDEFRDGMFNVLVATSVAEEGLDIPTVDTVIFFEPIPSAIRTIQRAGRTARHDTGKVIVLLAKGTRDEAYRWSAFHKEKRMHRFLDQLKRKLILQPQAQSSLSKYAKEESSIKIYADHREKGSPVLKNLIDAPVLLQLEQLSCADYVLSSRVGVEFKLVNDFVQSILDGRLLNQLKDLKKNFERPLVIIEGDQDIYQVRNIHPNAIRGMLATITISYGIPIIYTRHARETSQLLVTIAKREQEETNSDFSFHFEKRNLTEKELQEYIISSLPSVGATVAKDLLKHFGSVAGIIAASKDELTDVTGVGPITAEKILNILHKKYD